jgi:small conductance mechanosensitive channel
MTLRRPLAAVWHLLAIFYVVALYLVLAMRGNDGTLYIVRGTVLTAIVLLLVWGLDNAARSLTRRGFTIAEEIRNRFPGLQPRVNRYTTAITVLLRLFIGVLATATILEAWGVEVFAWVASPLGQRVASAAVSIGVIIALALVTWELVSSLIERQLTNKGRVSTRALTLLPLARTALRLVLIVLVTMVVLAEIGMNITPLLAGAGVIGLAVGFGAQKLVQDVITGWFILMEDTVSVGDVVDLDGGHSGQVERINIRTIQLRDAEGAVHTIPFSSVTTIKNMTRDFAFYLFNISVATAEDTDRVIEVLRGIDEEMRADPDYGPAILASLDVEGLDRFGETTVIIRARTKTRPIHQWRVGREFNRRIKKAFENEGIRTTMPPRPVYMMPAPQSDADAAKLDQPDADKNAPRTTD